jgi:REP element-mobilizing transposase RayT
MPTERYKHNAGAVFSLKYHLVWCPKYRKKVLTGLVETRLKTSMPCRWSRSYYIGSVGHVSDATVRRYIALQKERG